MIELRDTVTIRTPRRVVWSWLESLPYHYLDWHQDHLEARWVRGRSLEPGAVMEVRERLHGKPHRLRMVVTEVEPGRRVRYRVLPGVRGEFLVEDADGGSSLTAVIAMGVDVPVVGRIVDWVLHWTLWRSINAIERHQREEGASLKALLERRGDLPDVSPRPG